MHLPSSQWPDGIDTVLVVIFGALVVGLPAAGYAFMIVDVRAYLRSLRRVLIVVTNYLPDIPAWARRQTPRCLLALGLTMPCDESDVMRAYRARVKTLHPDRGGDKKQFLLLQKQFEESLDYVRQYADGDPHSDGLSKDL